MLPFSEWHRAAPRFAKELEAAVLPGTVALASGAISLLHLRERARTSMGTKAQTEGGRVESEEGPAS